MVTGSLFSTDKELALIKESGPGPVAELGSRRNLIDGFLELLHFLWRHAKNVSLELSTTHSSCCCCCFLLFLVVRIDCCCGDSVVSIIMMMRMAPTRLGTRRCLHKFNSVGIIVAGVLRDRQQGIMLFLLSRLLWLLLLLLS